MGEGNGEETEAAREAAERVKSKRIKEERKWRKSAWKAVLSANCRKQTDK